MGKNNKTSKDNYDKKFQQLAKIANKEAAYGRPGDYIVDNDERVLMPMQVAMMRVNLSKVQYNIILGVIDGMKSALQIAKKAKDENRSLSLFAPEELGIDENVMSIRINFKDLGVAPKHYKQLAAALKMMARIPIELPFKGLKTKVEYAHETNLCDVYIPQDYGYMRYCLVSMKKQVAERFLKLDLGYFYVGMQTSFGMATKYSVRLYWYMKANMNNGGVTVAMGELRKMLGLEEKLGRFAEFERRVLEPTSIEIKALFDQGRCECWFEYRKIYNDKGRTKGDPDAIAFTIYNTGNKTIEIPVRDDANGKENAAAKVGTGMEKYPEILDTMVTDLGLDKATAAKYMTMATPENKDRLMAQLITIKAELDRKRTDGQAVKSRQAYAMRSINNFFASPAPETTEKKKKESAPVLTHAEAFQRWQRMVPDLCSCLPEEDINASVSLLKFGGYKDGVLYVGVPSREVYDYMKANISKSLARAITKHFGSGVKMQCLLQPATASR